MGKIGIDFDGTCIPQLPESGILIGDYNTGAETVLKELISKGHKLYLWSCRSDSPKDPYNWDGSELRKESCLEYAKRWFKERGIPLSDLGKDDVSCNRKPLFDLVIDDISLGSKSKNIKVEYVILDGTGEVKECMLNS